VARSGYAIFELSGREQPKGWYYLSNLTPCQKARRAENLGPYKVEVMAWITPVFEEVVLCCEINSYVSAKL
jgi:hypothetical protein